MTRVNKTKTPSRLQGLQAPWLFDGRMNGELFLAWVKQALVPVLQRDDVVILDNLWSKVKEGLKSRSPRNARQLFKAAGAAFETVTPEDRRGFFLHAGYAT